MTGEDSGKVKLFRYPCVVEGASSNEYIGHSSHVTRVKLSASDKFVVSAGGNDKTLIVWETDFAMDGTSAHQLDEEGDNGDERVDADDDGFGAV